MKISYGRPNFKKYKLSLQAYNLFKGTKQSVCYERSLTLDWVGVGVSWRSSVISILPLSFLLGRQDLSTPIVTPHLCACWNVGKTGLCWQVLYHIFLIGIDFSVVVSVKTW